MSDQPENTPPAESPTPEVSKRKMPTHKHYFLMKVEVKVPIKLEGEKMVVLNEAVNAVESGGIAKVLRLCGISKEDALNDH